MSAVEQSGIDDLTPRPGIRRRTVLAAAAAGGAAVAVARLGGPSALRDLLPGLGTDRPAGRPDWASPLGSESAQVMHLLRRTSFGAAGAELEGALSAGYSKTVDRLLSSPPDAPPELPGGDGASRTQPLRVPDLQRWWYDHMLASKTPFAEVMTLFWHGHFTSDYRKVGTQAPFIYWQNLTWRDMALGDLGSMLMKVTTDPAMLRYLDLSQSTGRNPNENYSRELMELFTMGAGSYSEDDVRAGAKALAGWREPRTQAMIDGEYNAQRPAPAGYRAPKADTTRAGIFDRTRAYTGTLTYLGRTGTYDTEAVIKQILAQPATAVHIAARVAQQFVAPAPATSYVKRLADAFRKSRYDVKTLMHAVLTSDEFKASSYRALVKSPTEYMVHAARALNAPSMSKLMVIWGPALGQSLFDPPDVGGWPSNDNWVDSNTMMSRVNFVTASLDAVKSLPAASSVHRDHLDSTLSPATARLLGSSSDDRTRWLVALASPEFQLK